MVQIVGKYQHQKNENLDEYFKACGKFHYFRESLFSSVCFIIGIPYIPRKMMCNSSPLMEIKSNEQGEWTVASSTFFRNVVSTFKLGEEYEEHMPGGIIKVNVHVLFVLWLNRRLL